jgi:glycosyltransferase involved in cell wall biosynthesis
MRKLNIALFHLAFIYSGGGEKLVLQEYEGLKNRGHDIAIFTTVINKKNCFPEIINKYKVKTFLPQLSIFKTHESLLTVLSCLLAPFYASRFKNYDVILAANQPSLWIAFIINKIYGIPYVSYLAQPTRFLHPRKIDKETGLFFAKKDSESLSARLMMTTFKNFADWADKISVKNSKEILANGEYIAGVIKRVYKVNAISCPSGVNPLKFKAKKRKPFLLVTNRHFPQKRFEYAIFALNSLLVVNPNYRLFITGLDTKYTQELGNLIDELGLGEKVEFLGYVDEKHLKKLYKEASVYLYTAPQEDFGMGVIEAMSNGAPVVAWASGGPGKIIQDGHDGFLIKPFDSTEFSKAVIRVATDKKLAKNIGKNAYISVKEKFSLKRHIDLIEENLMKFSK